MLIQIEVSLQDFFWLMPLVSGVISFRSCDRSAGDCQ